MDEGIQRMHTLYVGESERLYSMTMSLCKLRQGKNPCCSCRPTIIIQNVLQTEIRKFMCLIGESLPFLAGGGCGVVPRSGAQ